MRILLLTHTFNSLTQRLYWELGRRGHDLAVEYDVNDAVTREAVALFKPDVVIAPYLRRAIPEDVWRQTLCLIVHPGIEGDRGPSSLDWAVLQDEPHWGVTVLQAEAEMDAGPIWATRTFPMRAAAKASLYRREVTDTAVSAVLEALDKLADGGFAPRPLDPATAPGRLRAAMRQGARAIDWTRDDTATVLRKIRCADGFPGVRDSLLGLECFVFDAHREDHIAGRPGDVIARSATAVCRATADGAVWIGHIKPRIADQRTFKLPAVQALGEDRLAGIATAEPSQWREIWCESEGAVAYLHFPFYNGAMSTRQCLALKAAIDDALAGPEKVLVLMGGPDFWSNGIHLNVIEAADSPADESWRNINAMDDLCRTLLEARGKMIVAAMQGNAGAGGVFLALTADRVWAREAAILNPHYKNMGNLYGSEYWTYLLPRRVGEDGVAHVMGRRLPLGASEAAEMGLIDDALPGDVGAFSASVRERARALAAAEDLDARIAKKDAQRDADFAAAPLEGYRAAELERMRLNFYGFDPSYHVARYNFVFKIPHSRTPLHLAPHRRTANPQHHAAL